MRAARLARWGNTHGTDVGNAPPTTKAPTSSIPLSSPSQSLPAASVAPAATIAAAAQAGSLESAGAAGVEAVPSSPSQIPAAVPKSSQQIRYTSDQLSQITVVAETASVSRKAAEEALQASEWNSNSAVLMLLQKNNETKDVL